MTIPELMRDYVACARRGDWDTAFDYFAEDVRIRIPGGSALAGEHRGRDVARHYIETARALSHHHDSDPELLAAITDSTWVWSHDPPRWAT